MAISAPVGAKSTSETRNEEDELGIGNNNFSLTRRSRSALSRSSFSNPSIFQLEWKSHEKDRNRGIGFRSSSESVLWAEAAFLSSTSLPLLYVMTESPSLLTAGTRKLPGSPLVGYFVTLLRLRVRISTCSNLVVGIL